MAKRVSSGGIRKLDSAEGTNDGTEPLLHDLPAVGAVAHRLALLAGPLFRQLGQERIDVDVRRERAEVAQRTDDAVAILRQRGLQEREQSQTLLRRESTDDAEIDEREALRGHHHVAEVEIAVEDPVDHRRLEDARHRKSHQLDRCMAV